MSSTKANLFVAIGLTLVVFYLGTHPSTAGAFTLFGHTIPMGHVIAHAASFGLLGFFFARGLPRASLVLLVLLIIVTAFGAMLELYQLISPSSGHYAELDDILVDAAGALCGALVCRFVII